MRALTDAERQTVTDHAWQVDVGAWHWCKKLGGPIDDHKSWGYEGLIKAVQQWDPDKEIPFEKWIQKKIGIQIYVSWRVWNGKRRPQPISLVPYDLELEGDTIGERRELASTERGFDDVVSTVEVQHILGLLTPKQQEIMVLLADGYTRKEAAQVLKYSEQAVAIACKRARQRLADAGYDAKPGPTRCLVCSTRFTKGDGKHVYCTPMCSRIARRVQSKAVA